MEQSVYTVSQVNGQIKGLLDADPKLAGLYVRGELSNYKAYPSGHRYFSMKDESGALRCVMFRGSASSLRFQPVNGMKVLAFGSVTVFPRDGQYQLYVKRMMPDGVGDLHVAFEQLKGRLDGEGLFDPAHKKPLPLYPERIALVTSPAGAAVRDMLRILGARWPLAQVYVVPCRVQGEEAAGEIAEAIRWVNTVRKKGTRMPAMDLIITGRGGGSMEDLWCFNEEVVARAIYDSNIPVISAVGHEPDVTIADYVADLRAATPSNGAELAVPHQDDQRMLLDQLDSRMNQAIRRKLDQVRRRLDRAGQCRMLQNPMSWVEDRRRLLDRDRERLTHEMERSLLNWNRRLGQTAAALDALSPLKVLGRGYAIPKQGETVVHSVRQLTPGETIQLQLADGEADCQVLQRRETAGKEDGQNGHGQQAKNADL